MNRLPKCIEKSTIIIVTLLLSVTILNSCNQTENQRPNVLFIAVDDLRPELGCFGNSLIQSHNIDRLANEGVRFDNAYCNVPVCGASRASLLTGIRPLRNRFLNYNTWADKDVPGHLSLPRHLKNNGYHTASLGKVYHHRADDINAWSEEPWFPSGDWTGWQAYIAEDSKARIVPNPRPGQPDRIAGPAWEMADCDDSDYPDGMIADKAIDALQRFSQNSQPFFLATGFLKPHLPFNAPKKYWDLYDHERIPIADNPYPPKDAPKASIHNFGELRSGYIDVPESTPLPDDYSRWLVHGYYACVSYTDAQIGRVLDELDRLGLSDNTIVILWGDHGWNLGEHTLWCKHCNYKTSLHAPIIIKAPGHKSNVATSALVEFVDIYPSIVELCDLPVPAHCEGSSFIPLMKDPERSWKKAILSRWKNGDTIRTQRYQYTEWREADDSEVFARMLYDIERDPDENINIAELPENAELVEELSGMLDKGWQTFKQ